jgi:hypothetical protein
VEEWEIEGGVLRRGNWKARLGAQREGLEIPFTILQKMQEAIFEDIDLNLTSKEICYDLGDGVSIACLLEKLGCGEIFAAAPFPPFPVSRNDAMEPDAHKAAIPLRDEMAFSIIALLYFHSGNTEPSFDHLAPAILVARLVAKSYGRQPYDYNLA